ncbi:hypothetical protein ACH4SK_40315 [Streptomyces inhibens]|uniref:hypothetical protein n=1 Tax=Streptomyces inhibens TaxID=2293571 RepID=UPI0037B17F58
MGKAQFSYKTQAMVDQDKQKMVLIPARVLMQAPGNSVPMTFVKRQGEQHTSPEPPGVARVPAADFACGGATLRAGRSADGTWGRSGRHRPGPCDPIPHFPSAGAASALPHEYTRHSPVLTEERTSVTGRRPCVDTLSNL